MDCCTVQPHLVIIGGGSAAFSAAIRAHELEAKVTMINDGLPIGGTCVNVGCVPSKTLIRAAEAHHRAAQQRFSGISSQSEVTNFKAIIDQKRELVQELRQTKYIDVVKDLSDVNIIQGHARFTSNNTVEVNGEAINATSILIASGVSPAVPNIPGLAETGYLTNETAFELEELPEELIVLGGRFVALESAQMFARLGSKVTILQRSERILPNESRDITNELTKYLVEEEIEVVTGAHLNQVYKEGNGVFVEAVIKGRKKTFRGSHILAATGRKANTANMGLEEVGIGLDSKGFLKVDDYLQTNVDGISGAGDVIGENMFVYTAAYEGKLAAENALSEERKKRNYTALPWVIFTDPQVAGVGLDEAQAEARGIEAEAVVLPLSHVPRALAARDTRGFIKLIRDQKTDKLIGARILAPEGSELLMETAMAIKYGITVEEIVSMFHPYLTLSEGIKIAAITFKKKVTALSCCAT
jgi:mercuric reductase